MNTISVLRKLMDDFMPSWPARRYQLNDSPLSAERWLEDFRTEN